MFKKRIYSTQHTTITTSQCQVVDGHNAKNKNVELI